MTIDSGQLIVWLITGALAGFIAGRLFRGKGFGVVGNIVIGLLGAVLGGALFEILDIQISGLPEFKFSLADLVVAVIGALALLIIMRLIARNR
jgi:uncharacterized membrane protein YeaQ/YmgE (transglycosylase-associated protein family)